MSESKKYTEIYDYLSAPVAPSSPESTVVFGRQDKLVARAAGDLALANLVDVMVITGGIGKDSGDLIERGYTSEADYLRSELQKDAAARGYNTDAFPLFLDEAASNGGENARNSLAILGESDFDVTSMTAVAHATSARRLGEMLKSELHKLDGSTANIYIQPSAYDFNVENPDDQAEARAELLRLADWPEKEWLLPQDDLPEDLVEFAREQNK